MMSGRDPARTERGERNAMATSIDRRAGSLPVEELIPLLAQTTDASTIAEVADQLGATRDPRVIRPLLEQLRDPQVQAAPAAEHAVCRALVAVGVMRCSGEESYSLRPRRDLADDVVETIRDLVEGFPARYF